MSQRNLASARANVRAGAKGRSKAYKPQNTRLASEVLEDPKPGPNLGPRLLINFWSKSFHITNEN